MTERFLGIEHDFHDTADGLVTENIQHFPDSYWAGLQWARDQQASARTKEFHKVADIPAIFVKKWLDEGFDVYREPVREIVKRLHREELTEFLTTNRRVYP